MDPRKEEERINMTHAMDSWRTLRMMADFVEGFEMMTSLGPSVAIFGSSNAKPKSDKYYKLAEKVCAAIARKGFGIITGGGAGIMERANKGAKSVKGKSCGLCINLKHDEHPNSYVDHKFTFNFRYFFARKVMFVRYAQAFVVFPGGYGTIDELFEALTLIQTEKIKPFPIYMVGKDYWKGMLDWLKDTALKEGNIKKKDLDLIRLSDDPEEIANGILEHCKKMQCLENF